MNIPFFKNLTSEQSKSVQMISSAATEQGVRVYLVGGVVRDLLLGLEVRDLDFIVEGNAISLAKLIARKFKFKVTSHEKFQTATVHIPGGGHLDFVTARQEEYAKPGALPSVTPGMVRDDLFRRDFTINAMAIPLNGDQVGSLVDFWGGQEDLKQKKIRVLHDLSFVDDPTRILRAVRFAKRFGFKFEHNTGRLLLKALDDRVISSISAPRLFAEFKKVLSERNPIPAVEFLAKCGCLGQIDGSMKADLPLLRLIRRNSHIMQRNGFFGFEAKTWLIFLGALVEQCPTAKVKSLVRKFQLSRDVREFLHELKQAKKVYARLSQKSVNPSKIYRLLKSMKHDTLFYFGVRAKSRDVQQRIRRFMEVDSKVKLSINGDDLKKIGVHPGKNMRRVLEAILFKKVDDPHMTKADELQCAKNLIR